MSKWDSYAEELIADLYELAQQAIQSGDWKVDGALDPDSTFDRIEQYMLSRGYVKNSIDGSWM